MLVDDTLVHVYAINVRSNRAARTSSADHREWGGAEEASPG